MRKKVLLGAALLVRAAAQVTVVSGDTECRLGPKEELLYLGPRQGAGVVHGEVHTERDGLRIDAYYTGWDDTGVFTRDVLVTNTGRVPAPAPPSLGWALPAGDYELTYLHGGWGRERQLATEPIGPGGRAFIASRGRSTNGYSPWFALHDRRGGLRYLAQLAWSGNWEMRFEGSLRVEMGMRGTPLLAPGESLRLPAVAFTAGTGDLDDAANRCTATSAASSFPRTPTNDPLLVQFNSWYPFPGKMTVAEMKRSAEIAAEIGAEVFVLDAGWYNRRTGAANSATTRRTARPSPTASRNWPSRARARHEVRHLGGDREPGHRLARLRRAPRLVLLARKPWEAAASSNFARPEVRRGRTAWSIAWCATISLDWLKIDYNIDIGDRFDPRIPRAHRGVLWTTSPAITPGSTKCAPPGRGW